MRKVLAYKLARPDGWDFYTGKTINYRENIGRIIKCPNGDASLGICSRGVIHASENPNDCLAGARIPCSAYKVRGIPVCGDIEKWGFLKLEVLDEVFDLDTLFGWKYSEAIAPINPLTGEVKKPTELDIENLVKWASIWDNGRAGVGASIWPSVGDSIWPSIWASVGTSVGASVWASVGAGVGASIWPSVRDSIWPSIRAGVGDSLWANLWASIWDSLWASIWTSIWDSIWPSVQASIWDSVGDSVRASISDSVWAYIGSLFPNITAWGYANHKLGGYPFQPAVDLWRRGFVPSHDGKTWYLHSGKTAKIVYKEAK